MLESSGFLGSKDSFGASLNGLVFRTFFDNKFSNLEKLRGRTSGVLPLIYVDPMTIRFKCNVAGSTSLGAPLLKGGDWDLDRRDYEEIEKNDGRYITCREMVMDGLPVSDVSEYRKKKKKLEKYGVVKGCKNEGELYEYLSSTREMYLQVARDGRLKSQEELGGCRYVGGVRCVIGRDGCLMGTDDGNHRMAISRLLRLPRIPVQVAIIHSEQLDFIKKYYSGSVISAVNLYLKEVAGRYSGVPA